MLTIRTIVVTPFLQNARVISSPATNTSVVLDPGGDVAALFKDVDSENKKIEKIVLTHSHIDHCGGVVDLMALCAERGWERPQLVAGEEKDLRAAVTRQAEYFGLPPADYKNCPEPDVLLKPGARITICGTDFEARFTPGHSPGHFSFYAKTIDYEVDDNGERLTGDSDLVFAGDALFNGAIGRTDFPGCSAQQLITSIKEELLTLPDETLVLPGHGPSTTIGRERKSNPFLVNLNR